MAIEPQDCFDIVEAVRRHDVIFGVCHVLRYTRYTQKLKQLLCSIRNHQSLHLLHLNNNMVSLLKQL